MVKKALVFVRTKHFLQRGGYILVEKCNFCDEIGTFSIKKGYFFSEKSEKTKGNKIFLWKVPSYSLEGGQGRSES